MEVVSIWEGGSLPAVGFVNETERKHHLGWKVSAGLFLPAWTVWMPESKAVWGRPGGGGWGAWIRIRPCWLPFSGRTEEREKQERPREKGWREGGLEGRKGGNRDKERRRRLRKERQDPGEEV